MPEISGIHAHAETRQEVTLATEAQRARALGIPITLADGSKTHVRFSHLALDEVEEEYGSIGHMQDELQAVFKATPEGEVDPEALAAEAEKVPDSRVVHLTRTLMLKGLLDLAFEVEIAIWEEHPDWPDRYLKRAVDLRLDYLLSNRTLMQNIEVLMEAMDQGMGGDDDPKAKPQPQDRKRKSSPGARSTTSRPLSSVDPIASSGT